MERFPTNSVGSWVHKRIPNTDAIVAEAFVEAESVCEFVEEDVFMDGIIKGGVWWCPRGLPMAVPLFCFHVVSPKVNTLFFMTMDRVETRASTGTPTNSCDAR